MGGLSAWDETNKIAYVPPVSVVEDATLFVESELCDYTKLEVEGTRHIQSRKGQPRVGEFMQIASGRVCGDLQVHGGR